MPPKNEVFVRDGRAVKLTATQKRIAKSSTIHIRANYCERSMTFECEMDGLWTVKQAQQEMQKQLKEKLSTTFPGVPYLEIDPSATDISPAGLPEQRIKDLGESNIVFTFWPVDRADQDPQLPHNDAPLATQFADIAGKSPLKDEQPMTSAQPIIPTLPADVQDIINQLVAKSEDRAEERQRIFMDDISAKLERITAALGDMTAVLGDTTAALRDMKVELAKMTEERIQDRRILYSLAHADLLDAIRLRTAQLAGFESWGRFTEACPPEALPKKVRSSLANEQVGETNLAEREDFLKLVVDGLGIREPGNPVAHVASWREPLPLAFEWIYGRDAALST